MKVEYYYSIASPFSYLGLERFLSLVKKYKLEIDEKPLDLVGEIFSNTGGLPVPKRHPSRQKYRLIEIDRIAKKFNVKINKQPKFFPPSDPHLPAKFVIAACKKGDKLIFGKMCLEYIWSLEKDISDYKILLGSENRDMTDVALLNRDYYQGRFASKDKDGNYIFNWDELNV